MRRMTERMLMVLGVGLMTAAAAMAAGHGLDSRIDARGWVGGDQRPVVRITVRNRSTADAYVLRWQVPSNDMTANLFDVRRDGQLVAYLGPLVKRATPRAEDYVRIPAGGEISAEVDLSRSYDFTRRGQYTAQYRVNLQDGLLDTARVKGLGGELVSNVAAMAVDRDDTASVIDFAVRPEVGNATSFSGCSTSRQGSLNTARTNATTYATNSYNYLNARTYTTVGARYTTWFGTASSSRFSTVKSHFSSIRSALSSANVTFNCNCTDSAYAYVYPSQPYQIWLCNAFWSAPSTGTDSKAGTLVHEMSHFNVVAGTDDWAYGQTAAKNLARSNPSRAVDNADSHEYFAENTPALSKN